MIGISCYSSLGKKSMSLSVSFKSDKHLNNTSMTRFILFVLILIPTFSFSQSCSDLIISEYFEGSGNNKGMELYNPTADPVDLSSYALQRFSNGTTTVSEELQLEGVIQPYSTWVVVNGQTEDIDLGGGSISPAADPELQAYADQLGGPYPDPLYMNGNDAMVLVKDGNTIVDIFGKPGEDPGLAWTDDEGAGYTSNDGGTWLTANKTLRRKPFITQGVTLVPPVFNALAEYDSLPNNTWTGLGFHECQCDPNYDGPFGGCMDDTACNFDPDATEDDGSCEYFSCLGCMDPQACNYIPDATQDDGSCTYPGCTDVSACNYDFFAGCDDGNCIYQNAVYDCDGNCQVDSDGDGICDQLEDADGSQFCGPGTTWNQNLGYCVPSVSCQTDFNANGITEASDLLIFLSGFGSTCE